MHRPPRLAERSAVELLVLRHLLVGTHIERRALVGKQPAAEGKIVAERVAHEIHGVEVPVLEIHRMHLVALRPYTMRPILAQIDAPSR